MTEIAPTDVLFVTRPPSYPSVAVVTLNRPSAANSLATVLVDALAAAVDDLEGDPTCRGVVITGAGRHFCGGADLKERDRPADWLARLRRVLGRLEGMPQPVVAAINGASRGGGSELALACDFRVMVEHADIGFPEVTFGALPTAGGTQRLPHLIGPARAKHLLLGGAAVPAARALEIGLIDAVAEDGDAVAAAIELLEPMTTHPAFAVATAKLLTNLARDLPLERGLDVEGHLIERMATPEERAQARRRTASESGVYKKLLERKVER